MVHDHVSHVHQLHQAITTVKCYDGVYTAMTEWVSNWKKNGWQTSQSEPVKNKDDIMQLDSACQKINVKWVSEVVFVHNTTFTSLNVFSSLTQLACE